MYCIRPKNKRFTKNLLLIRTSVTKEHFTNSCSNNKYSLCHHRLGHANSRTIPIVMDLNNVKISNKETFELCQSCCGLGKSQRLFIPPSTTTHTSPFELVNTKLWELSPSPSSCGYSCYIAFLNACTKFKWIYFLKQKWDAHLSLNSTNKFKYNTLPSLKERNLIVVVSLNH